MPACLALSHLLSSEYSLSCSILVVFVAPVKCGRKVEAAPGPSPEGPVRVEVGGRRVQMEGPGSEARQAARVQPGAGQSVRSPGR